MTDLTLADVLHDHAREDGAELREAGPSYLQLLIFRAIARLRPNMPVHRACALTIRFVDELQAD